MELQNKSDETEK